MTRVSLPPQANTLQGLLLASIPGWLLCWHAVSKGVHVCESTGEDAGSSWPLREEKKVPWWSSGTFFSNCSSPHHCGTRFWLLSVPRRALALGQLPASLSLCAGWDRGRSRQAVGLVPGGLLHPRGLQHSAGEDIRQGPSCHGGLRPFLCWDLPSSCSRICPRHLLWPSALGLGGISQQLHNVT